MNKIIVSSIIFILSTIVSFAQNSQNFDWLIGNWRVERPKETNLEVWEKKSNNHYTAKSFSIKNKDTSLFETIELIKSNEVWSYIVTTNNQNDNKPVSFELVFIGNKEFICLNLHHDFPTRIAYRLVDKTLFASIEGNINNKLRKVNFDYTGY